MNKKEQIGVDPEIKKQINEEQKLPPIEDLKKDKEEIAGKVARAKRAKEEDIREKVGSIETSIGDIRDLGKYQKEVEENRKYYLDLKEKGELPEDGEKKLAETEELAREVYNEMQKRNEHVQNLESIPEVLGKIWQEATDIDDKISRDRKHKAEIEKVKNNFLEWSNKIILLIEDAKKLMSEADEKNKMLARAESGVIGKINKLEEVGYKGHIQIGDIKRVVERDFEENNLQSTLEEIKSDSGFFQLKLRKEVDNILQSEEYKKFLEAKKEYNEFRKREGIKNVQVGNLYQTTCFLLDKKPGLVEEFRNIEKDSEGKNMGIMRYEYENNAVSEIKNQEAREIIESLAERKRI